MNVQKNGILVFDDISKVWRDGYQYVKEIKAFDTEPFNSTGNGQNPEADRSLYKVVDIVKDYHNKFHAAVKERTFEEYSKQKPFKFAQYT
jgi:hypothetical protein